jgi:hypothetical protein
VSADGGAEGGRGHLKGPRVQKALREEVTPVHHQHHAPCLTITKAISSAQACFNPLHHTQHTTLITPHPPPHPPTLNSTYHTQHTTSHHTTPHPPHRIQHNVRHYSLLTTHHVCAWQVPRGW